MSAPDDCEMNRHDYESLQSLPGNSSCVDCGAPHPDWGSPDFGILFCFQCSGQHRGLGTHITFVRSVTMDKWTERQVQLMKAGGNQQCSEFLRKRGVDVATASIRAKYDSPQGELYKQVLLAKLEGRPEPTELPAPRTSKKVEGGKKMQGFGSSPPAALAAMPTDEIKKWGAVVVAIGVAAATVAYAVGVLPH